MHTITLECSPEQQSALDRYRQARTQFESARDTVVRITDDLGKHQKAAEAADSEAQAARLEAATLMRDTATPMKKIHDLKAKERAAYTLAEDYRSIVSEVQLALDEATLNAGIAKREEGAAYSGVVSSYAEGLMRQAAKELAPLCKAVHVLELSLQRQASPAGAEWEKLGYEKAIDAALAKVYAVVRNSVINSQFDPSEDAFMQSAARPNGLAQFETVSAIKEHNQRVTLARQAKQLRNGPTQ
ncbi:MAG: hypothetical protein JO067_05120 [Cupriavidus sp.]|nr:hypothetical protein [Cupriavidus sp.]